MALAAPPEGGRSPMLSGPEPPCSAPHRQTLVCRERSHPRLAHRATTGSTGHSSEGVDSPVLCVPASSRRGREHRGFQKLPRAHAVRTPHRLLLGLPHSQGRLLCLDACSHFTGPDPCWPHPSRERGPHRPKAGFELKPEKGCRAHRVPSQGPRRSGHSSTGRVHPHLSEGSWWTATLGLGTCPHRPACSTPRHRGRGRPLTPAKTSSPRGAPSELAPRGGGVWAPESLGGRDTGCAGPQGDPGDAALQAPRCFTRRGLFPARSCSPFPRPDMAGSAASVSMTSRLLGPGAALPGREVQGFPGVAVAKPHRCSLCPRPGG